MANTPDVPKPDASRSDAPRIVYPCDYPIKVIGAAAPDFKDFVQRLVSQHAPDLDPDKISVNSSRTARFFSVQVVIVARSEAQISAIFQDLKASGRVHMVL